MHSPYTLERPLISRYSSFWQVWALIYSTYAEPSENNILFLQYYHSIRVILLPKIALSERIAALDGKIASSIDAFDQGTLSAKLKKARALFFINDPTGTVRVHQEQ